MKNTQPQNITTSSTIPTIPTSPPSPEANQRRSKQSKAGDLPSIPIPQNVKQPPLSKSMHNANSKKVIKKKKHKLLIPGIVDWRNKWKVIGKVEGCNRFLVDSSEVRDYFRKAINELKAMTENKPDLLPREMFMFSDKDTYGDHFILDHWD